MEPSGARLGDDSHCASRQSGPSMNLQWDADQDGGTPTTPTLLVGGCSIPKTMPSRLAGQPLEGGEGGSQMPMFLKKENLARELESV